MNTPLPNQQPIQPEPMIPTPKPRFRPAVLLIVLGIAIAGYFVSAKYLNLWPFVIPATNQQTVDETANWKILKNETDGWQIRIPKNWIGDIEDTSFLVSLLPPDQNSSIEIASPISGYAVFSITTIRSNKNSQVIKSPEGYAGDLESFISTLKSSGQLKSVKKLNIDSEPAYKGIDPDGIIEIYSKHKNNLYLFRTENNYIALEAISTFKFIEPVTIDVSDWQTYKNDQYGFEFKHPRSWKESNLAYDFKGVGISSPTNSLNGQDMSFVFFNNLSEISGADPISSKVPKNIYEYLANDKNVSNITFLGNNTYSVQFVNSLLKLSETWIFIEHGGHIFEIEYNNNPQLINNEKSIISTFKFL